MRDRAFGAASRAFRIGDCEPKRAAYADAFSACFIRTADRDTDSSNLYTTAANGHPSPNAGVHRDDPALTDIAFLVRADAVHIVCPAGLLRS